MAVGHQIILPNLQLFQQHEGQDGHLQSEREGQYLVARSEIGHGTKGETIGMV
jgi:hypothetical protein